MGFGNRIREERLRLGFSQIDFAELGGAHRNSQRNYEHEENSPDIQYLISLEKAGVDIYYIITGERGLTISAVADAAEKIFSAVKAGELDISAKQFASMLIAVLPKNVVSEEEVVQKTVNTVASGNVHQTSGNVSGTGNTQTPA